MKRGEIYYIDRADSWGSEQQAGRPAIIVSNEKNNEFSTTVEIVYLTSKVKADLPTHIDIRSAPKNSIALCEQVTTVAKERVGDKCGTCSPTEMLLVDAALAISLGLDFEKDKKQEPAKIKEKEVIIQKDEQTEKDLLKVSQERDTYKTLYEKLLERVLAK